MICSAPLRRPCNREAIWSARLGGTGMFITYWILFACVLIVGIMAGGYVAGAAVLYIMGFLALAAVLAALATTVTRLGNLEKKIDKLLNEKKDEHEE